MGKNCSKFHGARTPDPIANNVNICTEYENFDPSNPAENTIKVPGSNNNATNVFEPIPSGYFVPGDLCIPELPGRATNNTAEDFCNNIGDRDINGNPEWIVKKGQSGAVTAAAYAFRGNFENKFVKKAGLENVDSGCHYNDCDNKTSLNNVSVGCCKLCCAIDGVRILCERNAYAADPVVCCFLDNDCADQNKNIQSCFQTTNKRRTCHPQYRNLKSKSCLDVIKPYCMGDKLFAGQSHWMEMWIPNSQVDVNSGQDGIATVEQADGSTQRMMKQPCLRALARAVYNDSGGVCTWEQFTNLDSFQGVLDPFGLDWAEDVLESIFSKYIKEFGSPIGAINQDGYIQSSAFLDFYWNLCKTFPAICQRSLSNFCSKIKVEDLLERPEAIKWCGCYMTDDQYEVYEKFSINRECTPYCNMKGNIPVVDENDFTTKVCTQTTCIIDDVSIKMANIINPDGFNFNQLCNSCGGSEISKIFTGSDSNNINDNSINGNVISIDGGEPTFSQFIPDNLAGQIKFWYTDIPTNAAKDKDGHMMVQLAVCHYDPYNEPDSLKLIAGRDNPVVTLNYTSSSYPNYRGLGSGKLYYITGIKELIYVGNFGNSEDYVAINQYLTTNFKLPDKLPIPAGGIQDNQTNFNTFGNYNKYYSPTYNFVPVIWPQVYNKNTSKLVVKNQVTTDLFNCFSHYTIGFKSKLNISEFQQITNSIREDNIQILANTCSCIIRDSTIDLEDAKIRSLNINQHCGGSHCVNKNGDTIACGANSIDSQIISDVKNTLKDFEEELIKDKRSLITGILVIILLVIFLIWISVQHRKPVPKKPNKKNRTTFSV
jgi:hypothetical protein